MFFIFKITPRAFEIMAKNIPNLKMKTDTQVHEAQRQRQNKTKPKRPIPRHIIIKMAKFK